MILVIFGAGASYDSVPARPPSRYPRRELSSRLPLASELFMDTGIFADALALFPQCHPIIPYLQATPPGETLEHTLETLQAEGETDPERKRQMSAIRFYLHYVIWECERHWNDVARGITNYVTLLDQLRRWRKDKPVLLATFNYDRMLENALCSVGIKINAIPDYIEHDAFKLFKLHGSVHWGREVETAIPNVKDRNVWAIGKELIQRSEELKISDRFRIVHQHPIGKIEDLPLFPAIAIPVETKPGFECPADHLNCLYGYLDRITKILIVGWRATEKHFLERLHKSLNREVSVCVVAGKRQSGEEVLDRLRDAELPIVGRVAEAGFTEFVARREVEQFLG